MSRHDRERLIDILEAISRIQEYRHFSEDTEEQLPQGLLADAILYDLVVVGEAVRALSEETRERVPGMPWGDIVALRNLVAHEYFRIDMNRISEIVDKDIAELEAAVRSLLPDHFRIA